MSFVNIIIGDSSDCEIGFYQENTENRMRCNIGRGLNKDLSSTSELLVCKLRCTLKVWYRGNFCLIFNWFASSFDFFLLQ